MTKYINNYSKFLLLLLHFPLLGRWKGGKWKGRRGKNTSKYPQKSTMFILWHLNTSETFSIIFSNAQKLFTWSSIKQDRLNQFKNLLAIFQDSSGSEVPMPWILRDVGCFMPLYTTEKSHFSEVVMFAFAFCIYKTFATLSFLICICPMAQCSLTKHDQNQLLPIAEAKIQLLQ